LRQLRLEVLAIGDVGGDAQHLRRLVLVLRGDDAPLHRRPTFAAVGPPGPELDLQRLPRAQGVADLDPDPFDIGRMDQRPQVVELCGEAIGRHAEHRRHAVGPRECVLAHRQLPRAHASRTHREQRAILFPLQERCLTAQSGDEAGVLEGDAGLDTERGQSQFVRRGELAATELVAHADPAVDARR